MNRSPSISRRTVLAGLAASGAALALGGCSDKSPETGGDVTPGDAGPVLPDYRAYTGAKPDLPGTADGVMDGFLSYPTDPSAMVDDQPGRGGDLTAMVELGQAPPPRVERNEFWRELNDRLNVDLKFTSAPAAEYASKLSITLSGGDLPEVVDMRMQPQLRNLLAAKFQDLTELLGGDAIHDYPGLANINQAAWRNVVFGGRLYGIPHPAGLVGNLLFKRPDVLESLGANRDVGSADDLQDLFESVTDPKKGRWAASGPTALFMFVRNMFQTPNGWGRDGDAFTHMFETEQFALSLDYMAKMWKSGVLHPDSFAAPASATANWFRGTTTVFNLASYTSWSYSVKTMAGVNPDFRIDAVAPPKAEGGGLAPKHLGTGYSGWTALAKTDDVARTKEILRVLDWLSAPFGTAEYLFQYFGLPGTHHTMKDGQPVLTELGKSETSLPLKYMATAPLVLYTPEQPDSAKEQHAFQQKVVPGGVSDASIGLVSDTALNKGPALDKMVNAFVVDFIQGHKTQSDLKSAVASWRSGGGDVIRTELQADWQNRG